MPETRVYHAVVGLLGALSLRPTAAAPSVGMFRQQRKIYSRRSSEVASIKSCLIIYGISNFAKDVALFTLDVRSSNLANHETTSVRRTASFGLHRRRSSAAMQAGILLYIIMIDISASSLGRCRPPVCIQFAPHCSACRVRESAITDCIKS